MPSFRLLTVFYVFALVAAGMATFGPAGLFAAAIVLAFWAWIFNRSSKPSEVTGFLVALGLFGVLAILILHAVQSVRDTAQDSECMNNLKVILQLACITYETVNGTLPPAYAADANGKPMHSWRVLLLPHFGDPALAAIFAKYNLSEPWDGPNNSKLAAQIPSIYQCPSHPKSTKSPSTNGHYFAVVDPASGWPGVIGRPYTQFSDGTSSTVMILEASDRGTNWMEPRDLSMDEAVKLLTTEQSPGHPHVEEGLLTRTYSGSSRNVTYCDGSVYSLSQLRDTAVAKAMLTAAGGESIPNDSESVFVPRETRVEIKWGAVWGLAVFIALAIAPAAWLRRRQQGVEPTDTSTAAVQRTAGAGDA
jgi:type II secretory pathway pseudopilin PulG